MTSDNFVPVWRKGTTILFVMVLGGLFIYLCSCASLQIWPFCLCLRLPQIALLSRLHPRVPNLVRPISHLILEPLVHGLLHLFSSQGPVHAARASSSSPALIRVLRLNTVDLHLTADEQKKKLTVSFWLWVGLKFWNMLGRKLVPRIQPQWLAMHPQGSSGSAFTYKAAHH